MLEVFVGWVVPFVCGGIVAGVTAILKRVGSHEKAERNGIQCLLRAEIIRQHEKYERVGYCPIYAKEALEKEYNAYHALGGNDVASRLFQETMALPVEKEVRHD